MAQTIRFGMPLACRGLSPQQYEQHKVGKNCGPSFDFHGLDNLE
jgi:hypothetical protein